MENNQNKAPQAQANKNTTPQGSANGNAQGSSQQNSSDKSGLNLNNITGKLQEFGNTAAQKVGNLSTTQKVVGGSLLAIGAGWLAMNKGKIGKTTKHKNLKKF